MNIVVLVKQVPDSGASRELDAGDFTVERASASNVINEMDEYAIEEALKIKEAHGGEVTVLTMGPASATEAIRKALSMGPDKAVHVLDDALHAGQLGAKALSAYEVSWRKRLMPEFRPQLALRMLAQRLSDREVDDLFELVRTDGIMPIVRKTAQFNHHRHLIRALLRHPPARKILFRSIMG